MFRTIFIGALVVSVGSVFGQNLDSVLTQMKRTYDRIETFTADAWVYEYFG
jgi:outer membrane lipoprotein-sorting protein